MTPARKFAICILGAVVLCGVGAVLALSPLRETRVTIAVGGFETNRYRDDSVVSALVTISNASPALVHFDTTYQTKTASGWPRPSTISTYHASSEDDLTAIQPFTARTIHLPVPWRFEAPWRVVVRCTGDYKGLTDGERLRLNAHLFIFRTEPARFFVSGEQPANPALQATAAPLRR